MGFSTNNFDFCELLTINGETECLFTYATTPTETPFYYHDSISTNNIFPPAGWEQGGTEVSPEP